MAFTASHSFKSSPDGNYTAKDMLPLPNVIWAICLSCMYFDDFSTFLRFLKGFIDLKREFEFVFLFMKLNLIYKKKEI